RLCGLGVEPGGLPVSTLGNEEIPSPFQVQAQAVVELRRPWLLPQRLPRDPCRPLRVPPLEKQGGEQVGGRAEGAWIATGLLENACGLRLFLLQTQRQTQIHEELRLVRRCRQC